MRLRLLLLLLLVTGVSLIAAPAASAAVTVGQVLHSTTGGWDPRFPPTSYAYQWKDCDATGNSCSNITSATNQAYTVVSGDLGDTIRVVVTGSNASGTGGSATSAQTEVVTTAASPNNVAPTIAASCTVACASSAITWGADTNATSFTGQYGSAAVGAAITRRWANPAEAFGFPVTSLSIASVTIGDALIVAVGSDSTGLLPTSVACACVAAGFTAITAARVVNSTGNKESEQLWWGLVTSTGTSSVTTSGGPGTGNVEIIADDLSSTAGATWSVDGSGANTSGVSPLTYPSITPSQNSAEMYWGYGKSSNGATSGGTACTAPFACYLTADTEQVTYNAAAAAATAYAPSGNTVGSNDAAAAVFSASTAGTTTVPSVTSPWNPTPQCGKTVPYKVASEGVAGELYSSTVNIAWGACGGANVAPSITATCTSSCTSTSISGGADANATAFEGAVADASTGGNVNYYANITSPWVPPAQCGQTSYYDVESNGSAGDQWYSTAHGRVAISWAACTGTAPQVGIVSGGGSWNGIPADTAMAGQGIGYVRLDNGGPGSLGDYVNAGLKVNYLISGNCSGSTPGGYTGGVHSISASGWASCALAAWQNQCSASTAKCPVLEELNEPANSGFWGAGALSQTDANNYALIIQDTWNAFHNAYGASCDTGNTCPKLIASFDGGWENYPSSADWGDMVFGNASGIPVNNYVNYWNDHPYGDGAFAQCTGEGTGLAAAATGHYDTNWTELQHMHSVVGSKPVIATELGWQTGTGQCSGQQQADNLYGLFQYARTSGWLAGIYVFNYSDYSGWSGGLIGNSQSTGGGLSQPETIFGNKPAWTAIGQVASNMGAGLPNSGCSVC